MEIRRLDIRRHKETVTPADQMVARRVHEFFNESRDFFDATSAPSTSVPPEASLQRIISIATLKPLDQVAEEARTLAGEIRTHRISVEAIHTEQLAMTRRLLPRLVSQNDVQLNALGRKEIIVGFRNLIKEGFLRANTRVDHELPGLSDKEANQNVLRPALLPNPVIFSRRLQEAGLENGQNIITAMQRTGLLSAYEARRWRNLALRQRLG